MGTVYFVQVADDPQGPVKIGYTDRRAKHRRREAQTYHHQELVVLVDVSGSLQDEQDLHTIFHEDNIRGEWFTYTGRLQELVMALMTGEVTLQSWLEGFRDAMGVRPINHFEWSCDGCGVKVRTESSSTWSDRPAGWVPASRDVGPCGLTDYYRKETAEFCPDCVANGNKSRWEKAP